MGKQRTVQFNKDHVSLYEELRSKNLVSKTFPDFVKDAFHDKIDSIREKTHLSVEKIEKIAREQFKRYSEGVE